jgi:glucose-1-phosphate adenylyltransferase
MMKHVLAMILAGGEGRRLFPLTADRAKPAVPFGGKYRIIDFVLNNFINSEIYRIKILTQFKSDSLNKHISRAWPMTPMDHQYIDLVPAQMRTGNQWYQGTADAIYQNINLIHDEMPEWVCVFGGDHVYKMDINQMLQCHKDVGADLSIAAIPCPLEKASAFGVLEVDASGRVISWLEKPPHPKPMPGRPDMALVSMGNYIFNRSVLLEELTEDAALPDSHHDFGKDIIKSMITRRNVFAYDFNQNVVPGETDLDHAYWRDVGDIDQYWESHMDLVSVTPIFNLYNRDWPIRTYSYQAAPSKFVFDSDDRRGIATDSIAADGCIISGGRIHRSVLSPFCRINSFSAIEESILLHGVNVGRHARIRRAIIDKGVEIPPGLHIGYDRAEDEARGLSVSPHGVTVVPKGTVFH